MSEECMELQNIKYQTMLLNSNSKVTSNKVDSLNIDAFLEKERAVNKEKPWNKLGKNQKIGKITDYINQYTQEFQSTSEEKAELKIYLVKCLERKKLQRVKDVIYDSNLGIIKNIPGLSYDKVKRKFTLKKVDKKKSSLSRTAPKRKTKSKSKIKTKAKTKVKTKAKTKVKTKKDKIDINLNNK